MNQFNQQWRKLTALARQAGDTREVSVPPGFATRVVARAGSMPQELVWVPFEYFALRGLMVAAAFGVMAVAFNFTNFVTSTQSDAYVSADTVDELLELS